MYKLWRKVFNILRNRNNFGESKLEMKIIGIGRNYVAHAKELGNNVPTEPVVFFKPDTALLKNNEAFYHPTFSKAIDHEIEIVIRICREGTNIPEKFAHKYYDQIALGVDFTARDLQNHARENGLPWALAKGFNNSAPISNFLNKEDFDLTNLNFRLDINGETKQTGSTNQMLFNFEAIIAYVSQFILLKTGDLIYTGTPSGVNTISIGDRLEGYIEDQKLLDFEIK